MVTKEGQLEPGDKGYVEPGKEPGSAGDAKIKIGDEEFTPEEIKQKLDDLKNNENWKAVNTQKAQDIANLARELVPYKQMDAFMRANPEKAAQIRKIVEGQEDINFDDLESGEAVKKLYGALKSELTTIKREMRRLQDEKEISHHQSVLERDLDKLEGKYPKMNRRDVIDEIARGSQDSLDMIAKRSHDSTLKHEDSIIQDYLKKKKKTGTPVAGKGGGGFPAPKGDKKLCFDRPGELEEDIAKTLSDMQKAENE